MTTQDEQETRMVFRVWKDARKDVIALMPDIPADVVGPCGPCQSYMHMGQHGGADYTGVVRGTRPATDDEVAPLIRELTSLGYRVKVCKRR